MPAHLGFSPPPSLPPTQAARFPSVKEWKAIVAEYQHPSTWRATWQLVNTLVPYVALWFLMHHFLSVSWWLVVPMAMLAGALLARVFIIFHDCGHGSFFPSRLANDITGFITGLLTFTPYHHWRWEHSIHHASTGDLWTMTVQEYLESSRWQRFAYNLERCHHSRPVFQQVKPLTIRTSLKSLAYRLWDENLRKLVGYRHMREVRREQAAAKAAPAKDLAVQTFENEGGHVTA
ncbi:MAG: fatty acid desaturase [Prosthecobacter sp.]|uniref:fatty acid desaturase n=1 Tax=Prosthecobacter sp. TaxID=1965333 RepID=UPI0039027E66